MKNEFFEIDELFRKWDTTKSPGCALAVVKNGEIIYKKGYGMATLEHSATIQPHTAFYICSVSKQFSAFSIALLEEQGLLSVEDDVRKYIPELPEYGSTIQIQHLIRHTSGIRDYLELNMLSGKFADDLIIHEDAFNFIIHQKQLNFLPGERYMYSNSGYFLLSEIVLRVTGKSLRRFAQEHIFGPLGMSSTHFHDSRSEPVPNRAIGYRLHPQKGYQINVPILEAVGSGGIYSTVEELALWDRNFYHNKLGKANPALMDRILETAILNNGEPITYAFGLEVDTYKGLKRVSHSGGYGGYTAEFDRYPDHSLTIICLSNNSTLAAPGMARKVADILLAEYITFEKETRETHFQPAQLEETALLAKEGYYHSEKGETFLKLFVKGGTLMFDFGGIQLPLTPSDPEHFYLLNAPINACIEFSNRSGFPVANLQMEPGEEPETLVKIPTCTLTAAEKQAMTGDYYSNELFATASICLDGGQLKIKLGRHKGNLISCENHCFVIEGEVLSQALLVARMDAGNITSFALNGGRVQNLEFVKI